MDELFNQQYGSYISNIIDNRGGPNIAMGPNGISGFSVSNGTPGTHNWSSFQLDIDLDGSIYVLQYGSGFRGTIHHDLSGVLQAPLYIGPSPFSLDINGHQQFSIQTNVIKLVSINGLNNYQPSYVHNLEFGNNLNSMKFKIDEDQRINLFETQSFADAVFRGPQSVNYSPPFVQSGGLMSLTIFEKESDEIAYFLRPSDDPFLDFLNPSLLTGRLYDIHLSDNDIYMFGKTVMPSYPTTPSYRDQELNQQVFTQQPDYASGDNDRFITVLHSPIPNSDNTITDFEPLANTFCTDSYIHKDFAPIDGSAISWMSGDGSQSNHIVPDFKKGNTLLSHPVQYNGNFIQWQKSYDNTNWVDIPGAVQEDFSPLPEAQTGDVFYRRLFNSCDVSIESNVANAVISGNNDLSIDVGTSPYEHCLGSITPLDISVSGGSGDLSWQWYNGYATTQDIVPSSGANLGTITAAVDASTTQGGVYRLLSLIHI